MTIKGITNAHDAFLEWIYWCNNDVTHISFKQLTDNQLQLLRAKDDSGYIRDAKIYNEDGLTHIQLIRTNYTG